MGIFLRVCLHRMYTWHSQRQKKASGSLQLELDTWELSCTCWELNPGPLEEELVLLTEPSLQPWKFWVFLFVCRFVFVFLQNIMYYTITYYVYVFECG